MDKKYTPLIKALTALDNAFSDCLDEFEKHDDINELIGTRERSYPFHLSFDDLRVEVADWVDEVERNLDRMSALNKPICDMTMNELVEFLDKRYEQRK